MSVSTNTKVAIAFTAAIVVAIVAVVIFASLQNSRSREQAAVDFEAGRITAVAENSHRLDDVPESTVTVVEFLDFECEVCGAMYPAVEEARAEFEGEVTFVIRYFPIPSHLNSVNAALAAEAAAQQNALEPMYSRLFETQREWGEQQESRAPLFREFAESLGLDMAAYDAAISDPATAARVQSDFDAGVALGVQGTPTFFVNDEPIELRATTDLRDAIAEALKR